MPSQRYCPKCQKTMSDVKFYQYKNGEKCELCKSCLTLHINNYEEDTYLWLLEKFDVPYLPGEWKSKREKEFEKAYNKALSTSGMTPEKAKNAAYNMTKGNSVVFGKYLSQMRLKNWKDYGWLDTERLNNNTDEKSKAYETSMNEKIEEIREAYKRGEISEAEYMTYNEYTPPEEWSPPSIEDEFLSEPDLYDNRPRKTEIPSSPSSNPYPENQHPFEEVPQVDVGTELTDEDKMYLAMKWGRLYSAEDWVSLEKLYNEFMQSFDIQGAARLDTLKMICKTSLKMNQSIDCGDIETYQKLSRVYDAMMKSAKFTEAQRKEEKVGEFDSIGKICEFAESKKGGGRIERYKIDTPLDIVDETIIKLKQYYLDLIKNDATISQQIESYLKKKISIQQQQADEEEAKKQGKEHYELTDEDIISTKEEEERQRKQDKHFIELLSEEVEV